LTVPDQDLRLRSALRIAKSSRVAASTA